jgi:hypothetical protein
LGVEGPSCAAAPAAPEPVAVCSDAREIIDSAEDWTGREWRRVEEAASEGRRSNGRVLDVRTSSSGLLR